MDDVAFVSNSREKATSKIKTIFHMFQMAHFPLNKWSVSDKHIADSLRKLSPIKDIEITIASDEAKFLGIRWWQNSDQIGVFTHKALTALKGGKPSKRTLLKGLAQIYDPIGMIAPILVKAKTIFQTLWRLGLDWDQNLPHEVLAQYNESIEVLQRNTDPRIDRALTDNFAADGYELHTFFQLEDASLRAYGCITYLIRTVHSNKAETRIIFAKARVAPLKNDWSIHRYELLAALLAAKVTANIREYLKFKIDGEVFWVDNMACLGWIRSRPEKYSAFVANRVR